MQAENQPRQDKRKRGADPKTCRRCQVAKPRTEFTPHGVAKNGVQSTCRPCNAEMAAEKRQRQPIQSREVMRRSRLKNIWGLTEEAFEEMLRLQDGGCAICKSTEPRGRGKFHVDHDHATGKIRGLLCHSCNTGLGQFKDSVGRLSAAIDYLNRGDSDVVGH